MKVYINKYRYHWISPYTIMEKVLFWKKWTDPKFDLYDDKNDKYTNWLVKPCQLLQKVLDTVHPKIDYVKIDRWDTWSMYTTVGQIILPMLKQLKETKHGAPFTEDKDVPKRLRSTSAPPKANAWDTDDFHFARWDWILDQMIWSFENIVNDDWEKQFHTGVHDTVWRKNSDGTSTMAKGPNDTSHFDVKGYQAYQKRINAGLVLFGKYYQNLWD